MLGTRYRHRVEPWVLPLEPPPTAEYCARCYNYGIWQTPPGVIAECPNITLGLDHPPVSDAAALVMRCGRRAAERGLALNEIAWKVARGLIKGTTEKPVSRQELIDRHFEWAGSLRLRKFHAVIEELRSEWLLPVASRKERPHGYWIATDEADFSDWVRRAVAAPVRQLTTIRRLAKANFPVYAEQLELEFMNIDSELTS